MVIAPSLLLPLVQTPQRYIFDEVYHAHTAARLLAGDPGVFSPDVPSPVTGLGYSWNHPPAGLLVVATGVAALGDIPLGWRLPVALSGVAGALLAYALALRLSRDRLAAALAGPLLLGSGLWLVQSRIAMLDAFLAVWVLAALLCFHAYLAAPSDGSKRPLLLTGLFLGLAVATKWSAAYPAAAAAAVALWRWYALRRRSRRWRLKPREREGLRLHARWVLPALVALPLAVYLLAYAPFFAVGGSPGEWLELQGRMYRYHSTLAAPHPYQSDWWSWPLTLRGVAYYRHYEADTVAAKYALGNPVVFWAFLPAVALVCRRLWLSGERATLTVLAIGFFGQWLPWALVPRSAFLYHFLPAVPFGCLAVGMVLADVWRRGGTWRIAAGGYVVVAAAAFAWFYPIYAGVPIGWGGFEARMWLPGWR